jgi:hypothetical protein
VGSFFPEDDITRLDAFLMIYRALQTQGYVKGYGTTDTSMYADADELVNTESKIAIGTLTSMDILHGYDGYIYPQQTISRSEMAVLMYQTVKFMEAQDEAAVSAADESSSSQTVVDNVDVDNSQTDIEYSTESKAYYKPISIDGEKTLDNCSIKVSDSPSHMDLSSTDVTDSEIEYTNAPAVTVNAKAKANLSNSKIVAYNLPSAIRILSDATLNLNNVQISASKTDGVVVNGDSQVNIDNSSVTSKGSNAYAVKAEAGVTALDNSKLVSGDYSAVKVSNTAEFTANDTSIEASSRDGGAIDVKADYYDSKNGTAKVALKDVTLLNPTGSAFYINNADVDIVLNGGCKFDAKHFIYTSNATTKKGTPGCTANITLNNQEVEGDIILDNSISMQLNINEGSVFTGCMNTSQESVYLNVYMDENAKLNLTGDCYVAEFVRSNDEEFDFQNIEDNGYTIYYDSTLEANNYLDGREYTLPQGGLLTPRW